MEERVPPPGGDEVAAAVPARLDGGDLPLIAVRRSGLAAEQSLPVGAPEVARDHEAVLGDAHPVDVAERVDAHPLQGLERVSPALARGEALEQQLAER